MLVCRGRNDGSSFLCLMTKMADGCKIRISAWTGVGCEGPRGGSQSVLQGWTVGMLQDGKCREFGLLWWRESKIHSSRDSQGCWELHWPGAVMFSSKSLTYWDFCLYNMLI